MTTTYTITKRNGETITFDTDLTVEQAAALVIADFDRSCRPLRGFVFDLIKYWENHVLTGARLSGASRLWLLKLASDLEAPKAPAKAGRFQALVAAVARMQEGRKARVVLRLDGVTVKACTTGGNIGGAYLFRGEDYIGKITPAGQLFGARTTAVFDADALEDVLLAAAADPQAAAVAYGRATGSCACCGRELSDPVSVWGGIGPICLERLSGADARRQLEQAFKASQIGA